MGFQPRKVFISYSHDDKPHEDWVCALATWLRENGVDAILDQWDLTPGSDLPRFMESGIAAADCVVAVCTCAYVEKANAVIGGVGYEKRILADRLTQDAKANRIIPVIRGSAHRSIVPDFLRSIVYVDFRDDRDYETKCGELLLAIHGHGAKPRPPLGPDPFLLAPVPTLPRASCGSERCVSPSLAGTVVFDYSNNDGRYVVGAGDMVFETAWSRGGNNAIHAYSDAPNIRSVALALGVRNITDIADASAYDASTRVRTAKLGEIVVWQNTTGYYLATKVEKLQSRLHGCPVDEITFTYAIAPSKSASFCLVK